MSKGNSTRYNISNPFILDNNLIELGYVVDPYTWHNKRGKQVAMFSRVDHALATIMGQPHPLLVVKHLLCLVLIMLPLFGILLLLPIIVIIIIVLNSRQNGSLKWSL